MNENQLFDHEQPWWCKLRRADKHTLEFAELKNRFLATQPFSVVPEQGRVEGELAYRFVERSPVPSDLRVAAADAVHNLRSALDALAYELARGYKGAAWAAGRDETRTYFPICKTPAEFERFLNARTDLYGDVQVLALRRVQPFAFAEEARRHGINYQVSSDHDYLTNELQRLNALWNIDKHRRLPIVSWFLRLTTYGGEPGEFIYQPVIEAFGARLVPGQVVDYISACDGGEVPRDLVQHDIELKLGDDLLPSSAVEQLASWHAKIAHWVIPLLAATLLNAKAPLILPYDERMRELSKWQEQGPR